MEAAQEVRSTRDDRTGDPRDLFWRGAADRRARMFFGAEMILPRSVEDDFGRVAEASITFVRYEIEIGYEPPSGLEKLGRLVLARESLLPIKISEGPKRLGFPHRASKFRDAVVTGQRRSPIISTEDRDGDRIITIHQDGGSRGKPKPASATRAPATVVSTITGAEHPTILATRREMQSWRRLALEPSALRASDGYRDLRQMAVNGRHLPGTLFRVATRRPAEGREPEPSAIYSRVASRLGSLTGVGVKGISVDTDDTRELFTLKLRERNGIELPARSLSEGTLRFLALAVLLEDPEAEGVICMEEPENGIHPANLEAMAELLRDLAVDPTEPPGDDNPLRQVIVNTHSPALVQLLEPAELLFATTRAVKDADGVARVLRLAPLSETWRAERSAEPPVAKAEILPYLTSPPGSQLRLDSIPA